MPRLSLPGAEFAYDVTGDGPPVIQAHGMTSSRAQDRAMGMDFTPVAEAGHRLVRYDARGHGDSTGTPDPDRYTWPHLADDLLTLIDEVADGGPVDLIGASMGVGTALHAVVRRPTAFRRLVLEIPPTAWETRAAQASGYGDAARLIDESGLRGFAEHMAAQPVPLPPVLAEIPDLMMIPRVREELLPSVMRGAARSDLPDPAQLAELDLPVLLLPWVDDPTHPVSTAEKLAGILPDARLELARTLADVQGWGRRAADFLS